MFNSDSAGRIGQGRPLAIRHFGALAKGLCVLLCIALMIGLVERNWVGYVWSTAKAQVRGISADLDGALSPQAILSGAGAADTGGSTTLLAVGDIVRCPKPRGVKRHVSALASSAGFVDPLERSQVAAVRTVALAQSWPDAPVLALGDIIYDRGAPHEFRDCLQPIWGSLGARTLPTPGNHEYRTPAAFAYYDYWGPQAGPGRRGYYAATTGNWLILSLNSEIEAGEISAQGIWLAETLAASSQRCILAFYHRPAFSSQSRKDSGNAHQLFAQLATSGTDIILNGHNHFYERTHPMTADGAVAQDGGTVSFVVGTGGRSLLADTPPAAFTAQSVFHTQGILRLDLQDDGYEWGFHSIDGGPVLDTGRRGCAEG